MGYRRRAVRVYLKYVRLLSLSRWCVAICNGRARVRYFEIWNAPMVNVSLARSPIKRSPRALLRHHCFNFQSTIEATQSRLLACDGTWNGQPEEHHRSLFHSIPTSQYIYGKTTNSVRRSERLSHPIEIPIQNSWQRSLTQYPATQTGLPCNRCMSVVTRCWRQAWCCLQVKLCDPCLGALKTRDWKTRNWKTRHQTAWLENARLENARTDWLWKAAQS